ncbi:DUF6098 family protein [Cellulomonas sp. Marseille-Q8402]
MVVVDRLDELVELLDVTGPAYVRFSAGPDADARRPSVDGESGAVLPGWSVNRLQPEPWWDRPARVWVARRLCQYAHLADEVTFAWVLTGVEVGRGPDNEPLVDQVVPVARLTPRLLAEAVEEYHRELDAGRLH